MHGRFSHVQRSRNQFFAMIELFLSVQPFDLVLDGSDRCFAHFSGPPDLLLIDGRLIQVRHDIIEVVVDLFASSYILFRFGRQLT